jgi:hypothetical protein
VGLRGYIKGRRLLVSFRDCKKRFEAACKFPRLYKGPEAVCEVQRLCLRNCWWGSSEFVKGSYVTYDL